MITTKIATPLQCLYCESLLQEADSLYDCDSGLVECTACHRMNDYNSVVSVATCDRQNALTPVIVRQLERLYGLMFKRAKAGRAPGQNTV